MQARLNTVRHELAGNAEISRLPDKLPNNMNRSAVMARVLAAGFSRLARRRPTSSLVPRKHTGDPLPVCPAVPGIRRAGSVVPDAVWRKGWRRTKCLTHLWPVGKRAWSRFCRYLAVTCSSIGIACTGWAAELWADQPSPLQVVHEEFRRRAAGQGPSGARWLWGILLLLGLVLVAAALMWLVEQFRQRRPYSSRTMLFVELCWLHRLNLSESLFLWRWTGRERIRPRARIFCEPELWQGKIGHLATNSAEIPPQSRWRALYHHLFGNILPDAGPPASEFTPADRGQDAEHLATSAADQVSPAEEHPPVEV